MRLYCDGAKYVRVFWVKIATPAGTRRYTSRTRLHQALCKYGTRQARIRCDNGDGLRITRVIDTENLVARIIFIK